MAPSSWSCPPSHQTRARSRGYGYLVAATTGGEFLAAVVLSRYQWRRPLAVSIVTAQVLAGALVLLLIIPTLPISLVALMGAGVCAAPMTAWAQSLRMRRVTPGLHGRLFADLRTTMQGTPPLGALLAAAIIGAGATRTVLVISAVMVMPAVVLGPHLMTSSERKLTLT